MANKLGRLVVWCRPETFICESFRTDAIEPDLKDAVVFPGVPRALAVRTPSPGLETRWVVITRKEKKAIKSQTKKMINSYRRAPAAKKAT